MSKEVACLGAVQDPGGERERSRSYVSVTLFSEAGVQCEGAGPIGEADVWVGGEIECQDKKFGLYPTGKGEPMTYFKQDSK